MEEGNGEIKSTSHKNEKVKSYILGFKVAVVKYAKETSIGAASRNLMLIEKEFVNGRKMKFQSTRNQKRNQKESYLNDLTAVARNFKLLG